MLSKSTGIPIKILSSILLLLYIENSIAEEPSENQSCLGIAQAALPEVCGEEYESEIDDLNVYLYTFDNPVTFVARLGSLQDNLSAGAKVTSFTCPSNRAHRIRLETRNTTLLYACHIRSGFAARNNFRLCELKTDSPIPNYYLHSSNCYIGASETRVRSRWFESTHNLVNERTVTKLQCLVQTLEAQIACNFDLNSSRLDVLENSILE